MSEEQQNNNTEPQETPPAPQDDAERRVPESALKKQAADFKAELAKLQKQIDGYEKAKADEAQKKLEEEGKYKEIADRAQEEAEAAKKEAADTIRELNLRQALNGIQNEYAMKGAIASCPDDADIQEWATQFRSDNEELFKTPAVGGTSQPAQGGKSGGSTDAGWAQVSKDYQSGIPDKVKAANLKLLQYRAEHNEDPPGDWS